ncbi:MAG TPA: alkaline phosphatase PhoX [Gaiellaceae bacterium]|nr:alkaline phosphatase PhoX [Gaiellaceae bacterium]
MGISRRAVAYALGLFAAGLVAGGSALAGFEDWGADRQTQLQNRSQALFGVGRPLTQSSTADLDAAQAAANPAGLITVAKGLKVRVVSAGKAAPNIDQMVLWPQHDPEYLIGCNEEGSAEPALQRISLATGDATTIASGIESCDPVRATPWGTVLFGEENGSAGAMYELLDPLAVTGATIDDASGVSSSPNIRRVDALGFLSFEGVAILPNGVTYYGDELAAGNGAPGGAYYKFVPSTPWAGGAPITSLDRSPYSSGTVYGLRVGQGGNFGQGFSYGTGTWQALTSTPGRELRPLAAGAKLTGYYRPEDVALDEAALAAGEVRFCANNTGRDGARYFGETICVTDGTVAGATSSGSAPQVQLLVPGSSALNMPDNIAYQPGSGHWIVEEDGSTGDFPGGARNDDIWDCLDDGADDDTLGDGCIRVATLNDLDAESTGGFFDPSGTHYYVGIQHNSSGHGTILDITGWGAEGRDG